MSRKALQSPDKFASARAVDAPMSKRRGPAGYRPTQAERFLVSSLIAEGISLEVIRRCVNVPEGLSLNTLKKRFDFEINVGRTKLLATALECLQRAAADPENPWGVDAALYLSKRYGRRN